MKDRTLGCIEDSPGSRQIPQKCTRDLGDSQTKSPRFTTGIQQSAVGQAYPLHPPPRIPCDITPAPDDGRSWRRPNSRCQGRWPAWLRCVGDIRAPSSKPCFSERAYPTPSCCTVKRTAQHCLREINRRVRGPDRKGPRHAEPVTGNGAKASWVVPLECRQQLLRPSPGQTVRHGARADAQSLIAHSQGWETAQALPTA